MQNILIPEHLALSLQDKTHLIHHINDGGVILKKKSHWSFDKLNARLQVKSEVNEVPLNSLSLVLLLLQDKHGVVEELLQLFIGVVDAQLFKGVVLQTKTDLKIHCMHEQACLFFLLITHN